MTNQGTSRRTVLKVAAWSAPVIALSIAAPAASASESDAALIQFEEPVLLGDGETPHGTVYDAANNPLAGVTVTFTIPALDPGVAAFVGNPWAVTSPQGIFVVPLESTLSLGTTTLTLQANVGSVQSIVTVEVVPD